MRAPRFKLRHVMLDESFIHALLATDAPQHAGATELYRTLVDRYQMSLDRLYALSTVLGDLPVEFRRNALAPVLKLNVARQHRKAAAQMNAAFSAATALTLVMMRRERVRTVATASHDYDALEVCVLSVADVPVAVTLIDDVTSSASPAPLAGPAPVQAQPTDAVAPGDPAQLSN